MASHKKQKATEVSMVQYHQDNVNKNPKVKEGAAARGAAGMNEQSARAWDLWLRGTRAPRQPKEEAAGRC